jgi:hypothetical protein
MPPLNRWQIIPVPPPTFPSTTGPSRALSRATNTWSRFTWKPLMSFNVPSHVSATMGKRPVVIAQVSIATHQPLDHRVAHHAHGMRVGDQHRTPQKPGLLDPGRAGHLAVAVQGEPARHHRIAGGAAARQDRRDPGAHRSLPHDQGAVPSDERHLSHQNARDVGDRVERAGRPIERDPEIPRARFGGLLDGERQGGQGDNDHAVIP